MTKRPIKFRAWDGIKLHYDYAATDNMGRLNVGWLGHDTELTLTQFTGLTDKNGKEIWEGDVVRGEVNNRTQTGLMEWIGNGFYVTHLSRDDDWTLHPESGERLEVIGNVWENPDLTKPL